MKGIKRFLKPWSFVGLLGIVTLDWWYRLDRWQPFALLATVVVVWILRKALYRGLRRVAGKLWRLLRRKPDLTAVDLDNVPWDDFEMLVGRVFETRKFKVTYTKRSADQGIDVIATNTRQRVGIQCKKYQGAVGNEVVMAAVAGSKFYNCNRTIVVCTSTFTRAAIELADSTGVELWDRQRLEAELRWL